MPYRALIARSPKVQVLAAVVLVLFCLNMLLLADRLFGSDRPDAGVTEVRATGETARGFTYCEITAPKANEPATEAAPVSEELRLRAAQPAEPDAALLHKLGLDRDAPHVRIMK